MAILSKRLVFSLLALATMTLAMNAQEVVSKKLAKTYPFTDIGEFNIENKYGNINIYGWNKEELSITMNISVQHKKKEDAQEVLRRIKPILRHTENYVSVTYEIEEESSGFFTQLFEKANPFDTDKSTIKVDYKIYLPVKAELDITNKFGDVFIEGWQGELKSQIEHGDMWLNDNLNKATISIEYGEVKARNLNYGTIEVKNGAFDMQDAKSLHIVSDGSEIEVQNTSALEIHSNKDEINLTEVGSMYGTLRFTNLHLNRLVSYADLNLRVADLKVDHIIKPDGQMNIEQESSEVSINISGFAHNFNAVLEEGLVRLPKTFEGVKSTMLDKGKKLREINASYGNNGKGEINIKGSKGIVLLKEL